MPVFYDAFRSTLKNKQGKKLFYPRVVKMGNVSTARIARDIAEHSSLSSGDVKSTIDNLVTVMSRYLQTSHSVTLDGFGSFLMVMKSTGKGVEKPEDVSAAQASLTIRFRPASTRNPDRSLATRSMVTGVQCQRYDRNASTRPASEGSGSVADPTT